MKSIVLLRHGESVWNKENRFTGWTDVDLTEKGVAEAYRAGNLLKEKGYVFNKAYTSYLKRPQAMGAAMEPTLPAAYSSEKPPSRRGSSWA